MKKIALILLIGMLSLLDLSAQEKQRDWTLGGYVKNLQTINNFRLKLGPVDTSFLSVDHLLHNRLNFKWYMNDKLTFRTGMRNRIFYGPRSLFLGDFEGDNGNDFFDLSIDWVNNSNLIFNTTVDRLFLEYVKDDWEFRLGRQRINWGINTFWNPQDIFNAFNFTDFDYEERPGSDALRLKRYMGVSSSLELAVNMVDTLPDLTVGVLWKFNKKKYDFQILGAYAKEDIVAGIGWAGNLGNASFKGEMSSFIPTDSSNVSFAGTLAYEYSFKKGFFFSTGILFNSNGSSSANIAELFNFELSAKNLYPYQWSIYYQFAYSVSPLMNLGFAVVYSPSSTHGLFLNPTISYSIAQNWDIDGLAQISFFKEENYYSPLQAYFLRLKYSF